MAATKGRWLWVLWLVFRGGSLDPSSAVGVYTVKPQPQAHRHRQLGLELMHPGEAAVGYHPGEGDGSLPKVHGDGNALGPQGGGQPRPDLHVHSVQRSTVSLAHNAPGLRVVSERAAALAWDALVGHSNLPVPLGLHYPHVIPGAKALDGEDLGDVVEAGVQGRVVDRGLRQLRRPQVPRDPEVRTGAAQVQREGHFGMDRWEEGYNGGQAVLMFVWSLRKTLWNQ